MPLEYSPLLRSFFDEKIEYYGILPAERLKITAPHKLARLNFTVRSAIVFLMPYYSGAQNGANVSLYAAPRDYHMYFKMLCTGITKALADANCPFEFRGFADSSPIDERDAARECGLGIIGDNGLLINEKYGSYVFIGALLTSAEAESIGSPDIPDTKKCLGCGKCKTHCPSPEKCLSSLTQKKGALTEEELGILSSHPLVWGCDICQTECPLNKNAEITPIDFFKTDVIPYLTGDIVAEMSEEEFAARAYSWRGRSTIMRNLELFGK